MHFVTVRRSVNRDVSQVESLLSDGLQWVDFWPLLALDTGNSDFFYRRIFAK